MAIIVALVLLLLIPMSFIEGLITERQARRDEAIDEVSSKWGRSQTITGPIIQVPYISTLRKEGTTPTTPDSKHDASPVIYEAKEYVHILPEQLIIQAHMVPEVRHRGIYQVILYRSRIHINATFTLPSLVELGIASNKILWDEAAVVLGISDVKGITSAITVRYDTTLYAADPGVLSQYVIEHGISIRPPFQKARQHTFSSNISLHGSSELLFVPVGRETDVQLEAAWGNPSFTGAYLPERRTVTDSLVRASWKVFHFNRRYPQVWSGSSYTVAESTFGIRLIPGIDEYQKTMRTAKYAIMIVALTFLSFFMVEILARRLLHPIQYVLIGLALVVFYTLLLSLSEQIRFTFAYTIASTLTILLITLYTRSVVAQPKATFAIGGILTLLYLFLFVILQLQDYALLLGSIGLFGILAVVMYTTRNIDWFAIGKPEQPNFPASE